MQFQKEVYDQFLAFSSIGYRATSTFFNHNTPLYPLELHTLLDTSKVNGEEALGVIEIPVNKIVGIASVCGKYSYTVDFLPIGNLHSKFAEEWCNIYLDYLNGKEIAPISCYEYLGHFYVIDGKKRVSVMKCNGAPVITANVIRILPTDKDRAETIQYYSFLESFKKTGLYQVALCSKYSFEDLQKALGHEKDYQWTQQDRYNMLFRLCTVKSALSISKLDRLSVSPVDALMVLFEDFSNEEIIKMNSWQMAKHFKANKEKLYALCPQHGKKIA